MESNEGEFKRVDMGSDKIGRKRMKFGHFLIFITKSLSESVHEILRQVSGIKFLNQVSTYHSSQHVCIPRTCLNFFFVTESCPKNWTKISAFFIFAHALPLIKFGNLLWFFCSVHFGNWVLLIFRNLFWANF